MSNDLNPKDFKLVTNTMDLADAKAKFSDEMVGVFHLIATMSSRQLGRVLKAFIRIPVIEFDASTLKTIDENKLLISLIKMQDTKTLLMEAMELEIEKTDTEEQNTVDSK